MATTRTPRSRWIEEGLRALGAGGPEAVRVEALARKLGVTKGGFYWHFSDRRALLDEILDAWERQSIDDVIAQIEAQGGDARDRLRRLFEISSSRRIGELIRAEYAIRDWARRDERVARRLRRVDNRRIDYLRSLFGAICDDPEEVEVRCLLTLALFSGNRLIAADHGELSRAQVTDLALQRLEA